MGNCCSGDHPKPENQTEEEEQQHGSPSEATVSTTTATNTPFLRTPDTMEMETELEKSFLLQKSLKQDHHSSPSQEEEAKSVLQFNPRLIPLLEFFSHLYVRKRDLFRRVISVHGEDLVKVFKKVGQIEERSERPVTVQRSRSAGSAEDLRKEKFKVKTFRPDEGQPTAAQGGAAKPAGGAK